MNLALSVLSGVLLILLFPRFGWTWLAPVALTPILIACCRDEHLLLLTLHHLLVDGWSLSSVRGLACLLL